MGFCRTNLFKRLESSGQSFIQSVERHILRNYVFLHAIENNEPLPIGAQGAELLDARINDGDEDLGLLEELFGNEDTNEEGKVSEPTALRNENDFKRRAAEVYGEYVSRLKRRFKWLRPTLFDHVLEKDLRDDVNALLEIL